MSILWLLSGDVKSQKDHVVKRDTHVKPKTAVPHLKLQPVQKERPKKWQRWNSTAVSGNPQRPLLSVQPVQKPLRRVQNNQRTMETLTRTCTKIFANQKRLLRVLQCQQQKNGTNTLHRKRNPKPARVRSFLAMPFRRKWWLGRGGKVDRGWELIAPESLTRWTLGVKWPELDWDTMRWRREYRPPGRQSSQRWTNDFGLCKLFPQVLSEKFKMFLLSLRSALP